VQCACAILSSVACPAFLYFCTLSHKWHGFRGGKNVTGHKIGVFNLSTYLVGNIFDSRKNSGVYYNKCT